MSPAFGFSGYGSPTLIRVGWRFFDFVRSRPDPNNPGHVLKGADQAAFVLAHEMAHLYYGHPSKSRDFGIDNGRKHHYCEASHYCPELQDCKANDSCSAQKQRACDAKLDKCEEDAQADQDDFQSKQEAEADDTAVKVLCMGGQDASAGAGFMMNAIDVFEAIAGKNLEINDPSHGSPDQRAAYMRRLSRDWGCQGGPAPPPPNAGCGGQ